MLAKEYCFVDTFSVVNLSSFLWKSHTVCLDDKMRKKESEVFREKIHNILISEYFIFMHSVIIHGPSDIW